MLRISHWKRGEVCNSRRRSSCLRSSNRSVRHQKSTDQMRKSTAGFTAEHQIFELWFATSIQGANFAVNDRVRTDLTDARDAQFSGSAFSGRTQLTTTDPQTC